LSGRHWQACVFVETSARDPVGIRIPVFEGGDGFDNAVDECRLSVCFLARKRLRSECSHVSSLAMRPLERDSHDRVA
jgi:hypothetical protein